MEEEWKDIKGYEGMYQISTLGRIKSFKCNRKRILKIGSNPLGYVIIGLWKDNKEKFYQVHRIVAETFIENVDNKKEVNHIDGNKRNNSIENLEWVTRSENMKHAIKNKLLVIDRNKCKNKRKMKSIQQLDLNGNLIKDWDSYIDIVNNLEKSGSHIYDCCLNKRKSAYGYRWKYKEELVKPSNKTNSNQILI